MKIKTLFFIVIMFFICTIDSRDSYDDSFQTVKLDLNIPNNAFKRSIVVNLGANQTFRIQPTKFMLESQPESERKLANQSGKTKPIRHKTV